MINYGAQSTLVATTEKDYLFELMSTQINLPQCESAKRSIKVHGIPLLPRSSVNSPKRGEYLLRTHIRYGSAMNKTMHPDNLNQSLKVHGVSKMHNLFSPNPKLSKIANSVYQNNKNLCEWHSGRSEESRLFHRRDVFDVQRVRISKCPNKINRRYGSTTIEDDVLSKIKANLMDTYKELSLKITSLSPRLICGKAQSTKNTQLIIKPTGIIHRKMRKADIYSKYPCLEVHATKQEIQPKIKLERTFTGSDSNEEGQFQNKLRNTINIMVTQRRAKQVS